MHTARLLEDRLFSLLRLIFDRRDPMRFWLAVTAACAVVLILIGLATRPEKIDANNILSPWDRSIAPPAYVDRDQIKVIGREGPSPTAANARVGTAAEHAQAKGDRSRTASRLSSELDSDRVRSSGHGG
ncbi:MAG: hypothetical protein QHI38_04200 [Armatimonadota bacterium]|nr:hypothetical protein [Armatimonadota bacterium]